MSMLHRVPPPEMPPLLLLKFHPVRLCCKTKKPKIQKRPTLFQEPGDDFFRIGFT